MRWYEALSKLLNALTVSVIFVLASVGVLGASLKAIGVDVPCLSVYGAKADARNVVGREATRAVDRHLSEAEVRACIAAGRSRAGCEESALTQQELTDASVVEVDGGVDVRVQSERTGTTTFRLEPRPFAGPGPCYGLKIVGVDRR